MNPATATDFLALAQQVGPRFAEQAAQHDEDDTFVAENYKVLKEHRFFSAGVPSELGGGGASVRDLSTMLRELAHHCSSTALALSMHTHLVAVPAWRWANEGAPVEGLLRRVATEEIVLVSTGASDWLNSGGVMKKVDGGYRYSGRKIFGSGSPAGALLMTSGVYQDPVDGPVVYHFPLPIDGQSVRVLDNWRAHGMRGTGSNDVVIEDAFVPEAAAGARRKQGSYGVLHHVSMIALPIVYSVYVGVAESARDLAVKQAMKRRDDPEVQIAVGEMDTELKAAQVALDAAVELAMAAKPGPETTNQTLILRTLAGQSAIRTVDKALEVFGGSSFYRDAGIERLWRDVQGARYHPVPQKKQSTYSGRMALGLPIE